MVAPCADALTSCFYCSIHFASLFAHNVVNSVLKQGLAFGKQNYYYRKRTYIKCPTQMNTLCSKKTLTLINEQILHELCAF